MHVLVPCDGGGGGGVESHPPAEDVNSQRFLLNNIFGADHIAKGLAHLVAFLVKCESMHKESP